MYNLECKCSQINRMCMDVSGPFPVFGVCPPRFILFWRCMFTLLQTCLPASTALHLLFTSINKSTSYIWATLMVTHTVSNTKFDEGPLCTVQLFQRKRIAQIKWLWTPTFLDGPHIDAPRKGCPPNLMIWVKVSKDILWFNNVQQRSTTWSEMQC